ncbi:MAG: hypothetical protein J0M12_07015 [Deltaproteobacteria bacterium]|nr:hypothetical protein [Deltaproteobacteria bacterium]
MKTVRRILSLSLLFLLCGCQKMESTEFGVLFRRLPPYFFGGIAPHVVTPGETTFIMPWDSIYRFDTSVKDLSWGRRASKDAEGGEVVDRGDYVHTRALDGNEVALGVTIRFRISPEPTSLRKLVEEVATDDQGVENLVSAVGLAYLRTYMNRLSTEKFLDESERYNAVDSVRSAMEKTLSPLGVEVLRVNLDDFRFERLGRDGTIDTVYQDKLTEIQKLHQDTERERSRIETVRAKKLQELNNAVAVVNRQVAEAQGYKNQAKLRGDGYYQAKSNEAMGILATGQAEVSGIVEQVNALAGPGGEAILRLEIARQIAQSNPQFVLMGESSQPSGVDVKRTDTNELLRQIGVLEGMQKETKVPAQPTTRAAAPQLPKVIKQKEEVK